MRNATNKAGGGGQNKPYGTVNLQKLTTALVACEYDPQFVRREGIEAFFSDNYREDYNRIFDVQERGDANFLFAWLVFELACRKTRVTNAEKLKVERLGRYFVAHRLHILLKPLFKKREQAVLSALGDRAYRRRHSKELRDLQGAIAMSWQRFFQSNRSRGEDVLEFVTRYATRTNWKKHWGSQDNRGTRKKAETALKEFRSTLTNA